MSNKDKDNKDKKNGESESGSNAKEPNTVAEAPLISLVDFCDAKGLSVVDRAAVLRKYGNIEKTEEEWISILQGRIDLKK